MYDLSYYNTEIQKLLTRKKICYTINKINIFESLRAKRVLINQVFKRASGGGRPSTQNNKEWVCETPGERIDK